MLSQLASLETNGIEALDRTYMPYDHPLWKSNASNIAEKNKASNIQETRF